jgi:oxygen-independent coproporphyrinogen-3 oxidase
VQNLIDNGYVETNGDSIMVTEAGRFALHQLWGDASPSYRWTQSA